MKNAIRLLGVTVLAIVIGLSITVCDNGAPTGEITQSVTYTGTAEDGKEVEIIISRTTARAITLQDGDEYTIKHNGEVISSGTIDVAGGIITFKPDSGGGTFTGTLSGSSLTVPEVPGTSVSGITAAVSSGTGTVNNSPKSIVIIGIVNPENTKLNVEVDVNAGDESIAQGKVALGNADIINQTAKVDLYALTSDLEVTNNHWTGSGYWCIRLQFRDSTDDHRYDYVWKDWQKHNINDEVTVLDFNDFVLVWEEGPVLTVEKNPNTLLGFNISLNGLNGWEYTEDPWGSQFSIMDIFVTNGPDAFGGWGADSTNFGMGTDPAVLESLGIQVTDKYFTFTGEKKPFNDNFFKATNIESLFPGKTRQEIWDMIKLEGEFPIIIGIPDWPPVSVEPKTIIITGIINPPNTKLNANVDVNAGDHSNQQGQGCVAEGDSIIVNQTLSVDLYNWSLEEGRSNSRWIGSGDWCIRIQFRDSTDNHMIDYVWKEWQKYNITNTVTELDFNDFMLVWEEGV
ncbi:MAG: hypothetical protein FWC06_08195 [Treponema sp.]|nr:hypothetical protein [Treponema sp.]